MHGRSMTQRVNTGLLTRSHTGLRHLGALGWDDPAARIERAPSLPYSHLVRVSEVIPTAAVERDYSCSSPSSLVLSSGMGAD